ncbi:MAG: stage II sporulation protein R [Clostridia bacterium]|nr:stage II sporulation protein R [Clostridia bacterium]
MKTVITSFLCVALSLFLFFALPAHGEEQVYTGVLRLHILAASDSTEDQNAKVAVRDALLSFTEAEMLCFSSADEATIWVEQNKGVLASEARRVLAERGCDDRVAVSLENKHFDTRVYDGFTLPAGYYNALTVTIGEGKGQNFFCMLYPSLCVTPALGEITDRETAEKEGTLLFTDSGYALQLRSLEWLSYLIR